MKFIRYLFCSDFWSWITRFTLVIVLTWPVHAYVASQELALESPNRVKAAFLRNFAHYVTWPVGARPDVNSPWRICILGQDPFRDILDDTVRGRLEQEHPFEVLRAPTLDKLPACQIIFVAIENPQARRSILSELKAKPVLTVGDAPEFLREGGMIRFQVEDRVRMSINLDQSRAVSLTIQTRMLEVSHEVLENGLIRKVR